MAKKKAASAEAVQSVERIKSLGELAKLVNRNKGTVSRWLKRPEWTFGKPPWPADQVPAILRWAAGHLNDRSDAKPLPRPRRAAKPAADDEAVAGEGGEPADEPPAVAGDEDGSGGLLDLREQKTRQEVRKLTIAAERAELALAAERGRLVDAAAVDAEFARVGVELRNGFEAMASRIVSLGQIHGLPPEATPHFRAAVEDAVGDALRKLSRGQAVHLAAADADQPDGTVPPAAAGTAGPPAAVDAERVGGELPGAVG